MEAFSAEQKRRVYQCLRDNINKQLALRERMGPDQVQHIYDSLGHDSVLHETHCDLFDWLFFVIIL